MADEPIRVREVRSRWKTLLLIAGAALGFVGAALGVYSAFVQEDAVQTIAPISDSAERLNRGLERIDRATEAVRRAGRDVRRSLCNPPGPCRVADDGTRRSVRVGPLRIDRTDDPEVDGDWSLKLGLGGGD